MLLYIPSILNFDHLLLLSERMRSNQNYAEKFQTDLIYRGDRNLGRLPVLDNYKLTAVVEATTEDFDWQLSKANQIYFVKTFGNWR